MELDQEHDTHLVGAEVKLLALYVDIGRKNVVEDDILNKGALVILLVVEILDVGKGNGENGGNLVRHLVLAFHEHGIFPFSARADRTVGKTTQRNGLRGVSQLFPHALTHLADFHQLTASDNNTVLVDNAGYTVDCISHLMNYTLEKTARHMASPFNKQKIKR